MYSSQIYCFGNTDILFYEKIMLHALTSFYIKTFRALFTDIQGESKKSVITKNMAITTLKSIRKGRNWCNLNFPKHTIFFPFLMDFRVVMAMFFEITLFLTHPV